MSKKTLLTVVIILLGISLIGTSAVLLTSKANKDPNEGGNSGGENPTQTKFDPNDGYNLKVIKELSKEENFLISPYSIEIALNMLKEGAKGNTRAEIEKLVVTRDIKNIASGDKISVANAMFIKDKFKNIIEDKFTQTLKSKYSSDVLVDAFETPEVINNWVKENTKGMIDKILDDMSKDFVLGIANAVAIDVEWESPFECQNTRSAEFTKADGTKMNVEMMHNTYSSSSYKYFKTDSATGVIIPYKSVEKEELEFVGILPNKDVKTYISKLSKDELDNIDKNAKKATQDVQLSLSLPRFSYTYKVEKFIENLQNLGIKEVFDKEKANLRNIITEENMAENLYVAEAIHKAYIDLNEKGTKAAAVTYFGMDKNSAYIEAKYENIEFNKPFMYIIRDKETKDIVFAGAVYTPNEWKGTTCEADK